MAGDKETGSPGRGGKELPVFYFMLNYFTIPHRIKNRCAARGEEHCTKVHRLRAANRVSVILLFYRKCHFIYDRKYLFHNISIDCFGIFSEVYNKK